MSLYFKCFLYFFLPALLTNACTPKLQKSISTSTSFNVVEAGITDIHKALQTGTCTCEQLVIIYLKRIAAYDKSTKLNAIIVTNPEALTIARQMDRDWLKNKKMRPLHCIPVIVKDNYNTSGLQTTVGSIAFKNFTPDKDATIVRQMKDAGAIVLAKSNMAEWAFSPMVTISSIAGETLNPYNPEHVPAGSSGGTAAAVAASFGAVGVGTDTGNSIRGPSSHNSLVGFRVTMGLTSRAGIAPLFLRNDVGGPMARTVQDATIMLEVMAGYDEEDPLTKYSEGKIPAGYQQYLNKDGLKGARIGVLRTLSEKAPDTQVKALFEKAIADLKRLGAVILDSVQVINFDTLRLGQGCPVFQHDINNYFASLGSRSPVKNLTELIASGKYAPYIEERLKYQAKNAVNPVEGSGICGDPYTDTKRIAFRNAVTEAMDRYNVGALIYPTWNNPPAKVGDLSGYKGDNSQVISPQTGQPAFTVPMGFTYDNLPAGLQFLGRLFDEPTLIKYTYSYEQGTQHRKPPALFPALSLNKFRQ